MGVETVSRERNLRQQIITEGHCLISDGPVKPRGDKPGPNFSGLPVAALGGESMTSKLYGRHNNIPLDCTGVNLGHKHACERDCMDFSDEEKYLHKITADLKPTDGLTGEQRQLPLKIALKSHVYKTPTSGIELNNGPDENQPATIEAY